MHNFLVNKNLSLSHSQEREEPGKKAKVRNAGKHPDRLECQLFEQRDKFGHRKAGGSNYKPYIYKALIQRFLWT